MSRDSTILIGIVGVIIIAMVGLFMFTGSGEQSPTATETVDQTKLLNDKSHKQGSGSVTVVEFGDFECPVCAKAYPEIKRIKAEFGSDITFVFRHFPIPSLHKNAIASANAAEAAGAQGKFFEMHDKLYENQTIWDKEIDPSILFKQYAKGIGLDEAKFARDFDAKTFQSAIDADLKDGNDIKVDSTPTIFVNGKKTTGSSGQATSYSYETLKKAIEEAKK